MKILLTGFEPWGKWDQNPSGEAALSLHGAVVGGHEVVGVTLPVVHGEDFARVTPLIEAHCPAAVVSLGLGGGGTTLNVERVAVNLKVIDGGEGDEPGDLPVVEGGPAAYFSTLPTRKMVASMQAAGVPARLSYSAGTFLCNHIMYQVLHYLAERRMEIPAGFVHIPALPEQVAAQGDVRGSMAMEDIRRGILAGLEAVVELAEKCATV